ncbi:MAG: Poly-gamma-glutamate synthetase complex A, partial [Candidatus Giovannonibacteria bacterium GW2011_GWB1_45_9b]
AFSDFPGLGIRADDEVVKKGVSWAKSAADLIVVSFHFGEEYKKEPSLRQIKLAKIAIDAGADLVIGHHPHVTQPVEKYVDSYIAYSLGNFVFDQNFSEETMTGLLLEVEIRDKKILSVKTREIKLNLNYQPLFID